jgi:hypothetical protein
MSGVAAAVATAIIIDAFTLVARCLCMTIAGCALARDRLRGWACEMGYRGWSLRLAGR